MGSGESSASSEGQLWYFYSTQKHKCKNIFDYINYYDINFVLKAQSRVLLVWSLKL